MAWHSWRTRMAPSISCTKGSPVQIPKLPLPVAGTGGSSTGWRGPGVVSKLQHHSSSFCCSSKTCCPTPGTVSWHPPMQTTPGTAASNHLSTRAKEVSSLHGKKLRLVLLGVIWIESQLHFWLILKLLTVSLPWWILGCRRGQTCLGLWGCWQVPSPRSLLPTHKSKVQPQPSVFCVSKATPALTAFIMTSFGWNEHAWSFDYHWKYKLGYSPHPQPLEK